MTRYNLDRQRGIALVTVLLIIALGTTLISLGAIRSQVAIKRVDNSRTYHQLYQYALLGEYWSHLALLRDTNSYDSYQEAWARVSEPVSIGDAKIHLRIEDEQSRFNLNNLATGSFWRGPFINFLRGLEVKEPEKVYAAILDWVDNNQVRVIQGDSELSEYSARDLVYRPLDRQLNSVEEALGAMDIEVETIAAILPYVTVFPLEFSADFGTVNASDGVGQGRLLARGSPINPMTAPLPLFNLFSRNIFSQSDLAYIQNIRNNRSAKPARIRQDILRVIKSSGSNVSNDMLDKVIGENSEVYSVNTTVELKGRSLTMRSMLYKPSFHSGANILVLERRSELN